MRLKELIATRLGSPRLLFCHQRSVADMPGNQTSNRWPAAVPRAGQIDHLLAGVPEQPAGGAGGAPGTEIFTVKD